MDPETTTLIRELCMQVEGIVRAMRAELDAGTLTPQSVVDVADVLRDGARLLDSQVHIAPPDEGPAN